MLDITCSSYIIVFLYNPQGTAREERQSLESDNQASLPWRSREHTYLKRLGSGKAGSLLPLAIPAQYQGIHHSLQLLILP